MKEKTAAIILIIAVFAGALWIMIGAATPPPPTPTSQYILESRIKALEQSCKELKKEQDRIKKIIGLGSEGRSEGMQHRIK